MKGMWRVLPCLEGGRIIPRVGRVLDTSKPMEDMNIEYAEQEFRTDAAAYQYAYYMNTSVARWKEDDAG